MGDKDIHTQQADKAEPTRAPETTLAGPKTARPAFDPGLHLYGFSGPGSPDDIPLTPHNILFLQRTIGNYATTRLIQRKMQIGQPDDEYEREADRVAEQVLRMPESGTPAVSNQTMGEGIHRIHRLQIQKLHRQPEEERKRPEEEVIQRQPLETEERHKRPEGETVQLKSLGASGVIQRQEAVEEAEQRKRQEGEAIQTKEQSGSTPDVTLQVESQIDSLRGGGEPLSEETRTYFDGRFGRDFGEVRVHTGSRAADTAKSVNARAFTTGQDVVFGAGEYAPDSDKGRRLLGHELTHVVQQGDEMFPESVLHRANNVENPKENTSKIADGVFDALNGINNESEAIRLLTGHNEATRLEIQNQFQKKYRQSLKSYLKEQLGGDRLVKAYALLSSSHIHDYHTAMALALIPSGTRDDDVFKLLEGRPLVARNVLKEEYNKAFGEVGNGIELKIGTGSLETDLKDDLSGWRKEKSLALLNRDLTSADNLYFDSVGIAGTHDEAVVNRIQEEWSKGPSNFVKFEEDWDNYVCNKTQWAEKTETWTDLKLYDAMDDELSGETWELVKTVLDGYEKYKKTGFLEKDKIIGEGKILFKDIAEYLEYVEKREDIILAVAEDSLSAATIGGYTGAGTNEEQAFKAVTIIQKIWEQRIKRAHDAKSEEREADYQRKWDIRKASLTATLPEEMDENTADNYRVKLLLTGSLTHADEVFLAVKALDYDKAIQLVTQYWAQGEMNELSDEARRARKANNELLRPSYNLHTIISANRGTDAVRIFKITYPDRSDGLRGAQRLKLELDEGDSDSDLKKGYELLTISGIKPDIRESVVKIFSEEYLADFEDKTEVDKFLHYISDRYENSYTVWEFKDLLKPATDIKEIVSRAEGRIKASSSGIFDADLNRLAHDIGIITGEDTDTLVIESLERLRFIERHGEANREELKVMIAMMGVKTPQDLAGKEYRDFKERLEDLRELKHAIVEAIATAAELVIEAVLTILSGGAAAGALIASLSAAVAGMLIREAYLGKDYDLLSKENAQILATIIASAGFGAYGSKAFKDAIDPEKLKKLGRFGTFLEALAEETANKLGETITTGMFENRIPSEEEIVAGVLSLVGRTGGKTISNAILDEKMNNVISIRRRYIANLTQKTFVSIAETGSGFVRSGVGDLTGVDIAISFGKGIGNAFLEAGITTIADMGAEEIAEARKKRQEWEEVMPSPMMEQDVSEGGLMSLEEHPIMSNVMIDTSIEGFQMNALLAELEKIPQGSIIADQIRNGEMHLTITREPIIEGWSGAQIGNEAHVQWGGSVEETASTLIHEGTHFLDKPISGQPETSQLLREGIARTFEYEYRMEAGLPPFDQAEQAYRDAYNHVFKTSGDKQVARLAADRAMLDVMRADPVRYAVETPAQEVALANQYSKMPILEEIPPPIFLPAESAQEQEFFGDLFIESTKATAVPTEKTQQSLDQTPVLEVSQILKAPIKVNHLTSEQQSRLQTLTEYGLKLNAPELHEFLRNHPDGIDVAIEDLIKYAMSHESKQNFPISEEASDLTYEESETSAINIFEPERIPELDPGYDPYWEPEGKHRFPALNKGEWIEGGPGDGLWRPYDPGAYGLEPNQAIPFREGVPDFTDFVVETPTGQQGILEVKGLTGNGRTDYGLAVNVLANQEGMTIPECQTWLRENRLHIHHFGGAVMQIVPKRLHGALGHQGSAVEMRD